MAAAALEPLYVWINKERGERSAAWCYSQDEPVKAQLIGIQASDTAG